MDRLLEIIRAMRRRFDDGEHSDVLRLTFDDYGVCLWGDNTAEEPILRATFAWESVTRICFKDNGPSFTDLLYVFTRERTQALIVPLETMGGGEFWRQLRARGLFPPRLHERATRSMDGRYYCWPPLGSRDEAPDR